MNMGNKLLFASVKVKNIRCKIRDETLLPLLLTIFLYVATSIFISFKMEG